jgi:signal transduction histidine kinase
MHEDVTPSPPPLTFFAPPGRDDAIEFARKRSVVHSNPLLVAALDAIPGMVMILNTHRQIVAANRAMTRVLQLADDDLLQKRPGEVVGCIRPAEGPDGCGTSRHCVTCGAVNAILESQQYGAQVTRECRILTQTDGDQEGPHTGALDLRVTATPLQVQGERFILVAVDDVSHSHRMAVLQRVFFHDVLNTAGCILGYADYLAAEHSAVEEVSDLLTFLSEQLIEEIQAQRDLVQAESGDLVPQFDGMNTRDTLEDVRRQYARSPLAEQRSIELRNVWDGTIRTDRRLVKRILGNMLKNGLEATPVGQTVTMNCLEQDDHVVFAVINPTVMSEQVQLQMFQRSFSTKGQSGRGVGTYSMKLLGEQYLGGRVDFVSRLPEGTTFTLTLPKTLP